jgi:hypothetical protein
VREVSPEEKQMYIDTAKVLKGSNRRVFMAQAVKALGWGGQTYAIKELGWNPETLTKGKHELRTGIRSIDHFSARGRKKQKKDCQIFSRI